MLNDKHTMQHIFVFPMPFDCTKVHSKTGAADETSPVVVANVLSLWTTARWSQGMALQCSTPYQPTNMAPCWQSLIAPQYAKMSFPFDRDRNQENR